MKKHDDPPTFDWTPPKERRPGIVALTVGLSGVLLFGLCGVGVWVIGSGPVGVPEPSASPTRPALVAAASPSDDDHTVELLGREGPRLGTRVRHGSLEYRITEQRCGVPEVGADHGTATEPARGHFCVVTLDVRNLGRNALVFTAADQVAYTTSGDRYLGSAPATRVADGTAGTFLTPIAPGAGVTGRIAFDLPKGSRLDSLRLRSTATAGSVAVNLT